MRVFKMWIKVCIWFGTRAENEICLGAHFKQDKNYSSRETAWLLNQTSVLRPSLGLKGSSPGFGAKGASCRNLCQLICHRGLTDQRNSQPLCLMVRSSVGSSRDSQLKPSDTQRRGDVEEEERKPNPRPGLLLAVNTVKSPKVYCLSVCKPPRRGALLSQESLTESSLTVWPSCVFIEPGSNLTCLSFSAAPGCKKVIWGRKSASAIRLRGGRRLPCLPYRGPYRPGTSRPRPARVYHKTGLTVHYAITLKPHGL